MLERLSRYKRLEQYPEDTELLDDVIIENKQAIEMTMIYRDIINGTRELVSSVINNRLNNVMKYLNVNHSGYGDSDDYFRIVRNERQWEMDAIV
mgnify:CR=1 FL=1